MEDYNSGKWIGWNGGECPVHPKTEVEYAMGHSTSKEPAHRLRWEHKGMTSDIIAFRVIKEHKEPREWWITNRSGYSHPHETLESAESYARANHAYRTEIIHVREVLE